MLCSIIVPSKDYKAIEQYVRRGKILMTEVIGRTYEVSGDDFSITAEIMSDQQAILYRLYTGQEVYSKVVKAPVCYFPDWGITVAFDIDRSYD